MFTTKQDEYINELMEELAEGIYIASKFRRFGEDNWRPDDLNKRTNGVCLEDNLADVIAMILVAPSYVKSISHTGLAAKVVDKLAAMKQWTNL